MLGYEFTQNIYLPNQIKGDVIFSSYQEIMLNA